MKDVLNKKFEVLDHGYVICVDKMGSDEDIVRAARVSYDEASTKKARSSAGLIDFLIRHNHSSPIEMCELKFEIKMPIFVMRQWVRHRTANLNEMSGRYSEMPEEYYLPHESAVGAQSSSNKQVRDIDPAARHPHGEAFRRHVREGGSKSFLDYKEDLEKGIPRELARVQLPLGTYTKVVWKMDLRNLLHFLKLRTDAHAQYEIRVYAEVIEEIVAALYPLTYSSWKNHIKEAISFSSDEQKILKYIIGLGKTKEVMEIAQGQLNKSRFREFCQKIDKIYDK